MSKAVTVSKSNAVVAFDPVKTGRNIDSLWTAYSKLENQATMVRQDADECKEELIAELRDAHDHVADFSAFIKEHTKIGRSTAYRMLAITDGRGDEVRQQERTRKQKSRAVSVTKPVTDSPNTLRDVLGALNVVVQGDGTVAGGKRGQEVVAKILAKYGVTNVHKLKPQHYGDVLADFGEHLIGRDVPVADAPPVIPVPAPVKWDEQLANMTTTEFETRIAADKSATGLQSYLDLLAEHEQLGQRLAALAKDHPLSIDDARKFIEACRGRLGDYLDEGAWDRAFNGIGQRVDEADTIVTLTKDAKAAAKDPERYMQRAREEQQADEMQSDREDAKQEAKDDGESWSDVKEQWEADWIADNWDAHREASFMRGFVSDWQARHGKPFPNSKYLDAKAAA